jgi:protein SCO1/2
VREGARTRLLAGAAAAALLTLTAACGGGSAENGDGVVTDVVEGDQDGMHGAVLDSPYTWGQTELTDTAGEPFDTRDELAAPLTLVFFGYTNCPDICRP